MWPLELYGVGSALELVRSLSTVERVGVQFAVTLLLAMIVLGMFQGYGMRTVRKSRRSPIISICIGLPAALVVVGLAATGYLIVGTSLGTFFGIPLVVLGLAVVPALSALGFVAIGRSIAARLGRDRLWLGVLLGAVLSGASAASLPATVAVVALAAALGVGAGVRIAVGAGGTAGPDERTVPPANKI